MSELNIIESTSESAASNVREPLFTKGFFGVIGPAASEHRPRTPESFGECAAEVLRTDSARIFALGNTSATLQLRENSPSLAIFDGRPFLLSELTRANFADWNSTKWIERFLTELDGKFSCCIRTDDSHFILATDLLGAASVVYSEIQGSIFFASHLGILLFNLPKFPNLDHLGIAALMSSSTGFRNRTPYEGIHRLESCEYLNIEANREKASVVRRCYASVPDVIFHGNHRGVSSVDDCVNELTELMQASIKRENYPNHIALMLSGGRDSRAIACALANSSECPTIETVTFGHPQSLELIRAKQVAGRLRMKHHAVPHTTWDFGTHSRRIAEVNGGSSGLHASNMLEGYEVASSISSVTPVGFLGDAISGAHLPKREATSFRHVENSILWGARDRRVSMEFQKEIAVLREELQLEYKALDFMPPYQRHLCLDITTRQTGYISVTFDLAQSFLEISYPFFYRPLLRFWLNLPLSLLQRQNLYDTWLDKVYSSAASRRGRLTSELTFRSNKLAMKFRARCSPPKKNVDWKQKLDQSRDWCMDTINNYCRDKRLKRFSLECLDESSNAKLSPGLNPVVYAIAPVVARKHALT